jgi:multidrug resistance efflux pump
MVVATKESGMKLSSLAIRWIVLIVLLILGWAAYALFTHYYVYTSDAYVQGQFVSIAPEITGTVTQIHTQEGQQVKKGQVLFRLDPKPYLLQLKQDIASLHTAQNTKAQLKASIASSEAAKTAALINVQHTYATWHHMAGVARAAFSEQAVKNAQYAFNAAQAQLAKAQHDIAVFRKQLGPQNQIFPLIAQAHTAIQTDRYNLSKTVIRAPLTGIVTNDYLEKGTLAQANQPVFAIINPHHFWITARYKEGTLPDLKLGDHVSVYLKMYGTHTFKGTVTDIGYGVNRRQASSTVVNSVLPFLEQSEDWIQLQQRFPVRISLDPAPADMPYRIGASARLLVHRN